MKNEGFLERLIQATLSIALLLGSVFWIGGLWQIALLIMSALVGAFAAIGFCPLYAIMGRSGSCSIARLTRSRIIFFFAYVLLLLAAGTYASIFFSRKIFIEDFNRLNGDYKQALFQTGQANQTAAEENYAKLLASYAAFEKKYSTYHPYAIWGDRAFDGDLLKIREIITGAGTAIHSGDLKASHAELEAVRTITQAFLKRNGFSMLSIALVDFHDAMEKVLTAANAEDAAGVLAAYAEADSGLQTVELETDDVEIQAIRQNLETVRQAAESDAADTLPAKAGELKKSFVKVYLSRG